MNQQNKLRQIVFYKNYFQEFFVKQRDKVKDKIIWTLELIEELPRVPETYLNLLKTQMVCLKSEYNLVMIFSVFFVSLTKES